MGEDELRGHIAEVRDEHVKADNGYQCCCRAEWCTYGDEGDYWPCHAIQLADALEAVLDGEAIRAAQETAWERGFAAGEKDYALHNERNDWADPGQRCIPNPYWAGTS